MGNNCGCGTKKEGLTDEEEKALIKLQANTRTYLAKKQVELLKEAAFASIFSNIHEYGFILNHLGLDRKNHKCSETWMLSQRIGAINMDKIKFTDNEPRVFYDKLTDDKEGR